MEYSVVYKLHIMPTPTAAQKDTPADALELLRSLDDARVDRGLSKADLARLSGLPAETVRKLLTKGSNAKLKTVLTMARHLGLELQLVPSEVTTNQGATDPETVMAWLSHYGAPLYGSSEIRNVPSPEVVLAEGVVLSRTDATVARALPVALYRLWPRLDVDELRRLVEKRGQGRALGFFLDLTAEISGHPSLAKVAESLRPQQPRQRANQFFPVSSRLERTLAEKKTPAVARRWDFRMNMELDSFVSMFRKSMAAD